jgi:flagellar hook-associated protein 1 FlgK
MNELPPEDLIVVLDKEGARRLGAQYELMDAVEEHGTERNYRLEMTDQTTGKIEVIDKANGHSIATRYTSGITELDIDGFRLRLSGFADQNDFFEIGLNQSKSGDARNAEALVELNRSSSERNSFQEDFRSIALAVGSQLVSGRLVEVSATSMRDAARATEDELSGVNLDQEASQLMEQQQAYKAAAQILQAARQMFDTLVGIM